MSKSFNIEENKKLKENPFTVPDGYFEGLSAQINFRKGLPETDGFTVPKNYFESLPGSILGKIKLEEAGHENPFLVPPAYFEELPDQIKATIAFHQLNKLKEDAHALPEGYFNTLADRIKSRIAAEEGDVKVIVMKRSSTRSYWAIAASVAILIGFIGVFYLSSAPTDTNILLSENTKTQIIENPDLYNIDEASMLEEMGISEEEAGNEQDAEEFLLESETEIGTDINETE